jgi:hypothetical protein
MPRVILDVMPEDMLTVMRQSMPQEKYTMKLLLSTLFVAATIGFAPAAFAVDNSISALCDGAPEHASYARPGGFCSQVASNASLFPTSGGSDCADWEVFDPRTRECVCVHES